MNPTTCEACGAFLPASGRFCPRCGAATTGQALPVDPAPRAKQEAQVIHETPSVRESEQDGADTRKRCPHCGLPATGVICDGCGANLSYARLLTAEEWAAKNSASTQAASVSRLAPDVIVTTTNDLPGYRILKIHGEVFGLTARARNVFANLTAKGRTVVGGEVRSYSRLLTDSREEAVLRLREAAAEQGANAVLAMRFDANEFGDVISEIVAYGTAATVEEV
jgi:uncharacterized protein YbjQ (UPF0145 family)